MENFWAKFNKPIYALAPMASVADSAFRQICKKFGADLLYSEMASATALTYDPKKTIELIEFDMKEKPYIVQLFGNEPKHFAHATRLISNDLKEFIPNGIDLNLGCPVKKVQKQGAGAVLMADMKRAKDCIKSIIDNTDLPVSIKVRTQVHDIGVLQFLDYISDLDIKALMIHGRTLKQGFSGEIDTGVIKKAREYFGGFIIANGFVENSVNNTKETPKEYYDNILQATGVDGIGIARAALGRPWIFDAVKNGESLEKYIEKIKPIIMEHANLVFKLKGDKGILEMRKHLCWYINGFPGAKELRKKLIEVTSISQIEEIFKNI